MVIEQKAADTLKLLQGEISTYEARLREFLQAGQQGKYVLITGDEVKGFYIDYASAAKAGYEACGTSKPFLVQQIEGRHRVHYFRVLNEQTDPAAHPW